MGQVVKSLPAMQETEVQSLGGADPLEKGMTTHFSILAWKIHRRRSLAGYVHGITNSHTHLRD